MRKFSRRASLGVAAAAALTVAALTGPAAASSGGSHGEGYGNCPNGYVGLTFDDGPSATTPQLLKALTDAHLRATMFNMGSNAQAHPDLVRQEVAAGMWVGNHTFTHPDMTTLSSNQSFEELASTQWVLSSILGKAPTLYRPPYGSTDAQVRAQEQQLHLLEVLWTVDSRDWAGASADDIVAAVRTLQPGGIILMHDWPANTIAAIPRIAEVLKEKGLCAGRIVYTPQDISGVGTTFHAIAVKP
jgi:peptidoglycan/xylan/chitin deacetylase (PgdA/CDA1 family)